MDILLFGQLQFTLEGAGLGLLATVPMLLGLAWILTTSWRPARELIALVTEQLAPLLAGCSLLQLGLLAALAGVAEEALFRGVVQTALDRLVAEPVAVLVAAAIFGLAHFVSWTYALLAALIGVYLGTLFLISGNLLPPILAHTLYDFVALIALNSRHGRHQRHQETHLGPPLST